MSRSDQEIIGAVRAGDRDAYRGLVDRYRDRLMGVIVRMTGDRGEAEEIAQEAFVKAYLRLDSFRGEASFGTWVVQIGVHLVRDRARRRRRAERAPLGGRVVSLDAYRERHGTGTEPRAPARSNDPLERLCREEVQERLAAVLAHLPAEYREVLTLKHLEDWSYDEIAAITGATPGTIRVRAHRARQLLRELMAAADADAEGAGGSGGPDSRRIPGDDLR
jgi:RNA polymerase sigma-70 factor (ECF subfamily)